MWAAIRYRRAAPVRERVLALLRAEAVRGAIVLMATHDPEAAEEADGELRLDDGRLEVVREPGG